MILGGAWLLDTGLKGRREGKLWTVSNHVPSLRTKIEVKRTLS
jgi:hypothetical protein